MSSSSGSIEVFSDKKSGVFTYGGCENLSKESSESKDSGLADESLQNRESDDRQRPLHNRHDDDHQDNGQTIVNNNNNNNNNNNATNVSQRTAERQTELAGRKKTSKDDGTGRHAVRNINSTKASRNSSDLNELTKGKERKSMLSKIMKKFYSTSRWNVNENTIVPGNQPNDDSLFAGPSEACVVLKNMNYNLSYKKEKRQRRPALQIKKLQKPIELFRNETVEQFHQRMQLFGAKFVIVDDRIESVILEEGKVTFVDELRDSEIKKKNDWFSKNLVKYSLPFGEHDDAPSTAQLDTVHSSLSAVIESLKNQQNNDNIVPNVTATKSNKSFFGTSLKELQAGDGFVILGQLIAFLKKDCSTEGIFRIAARHSRINTLKKQIDEFYNESVKTLDKISMMGEMFYNYNSIELASILKVFIRELPEPLIPQEYSEAFLSVPQTSATVAEQIRRLNLLILAMPTSHSIPLRMVLSLLNECSAKVSDNKMTVDAISLIIAPNIFPELEDKSYQSSGGDKDRKPNSARLSEQNFADLMDRTNNAFGTICLLINLVEVLFHFPLDIYKNVI